MFGGNIMHKFKHWMFRAYIFVVLGDLIWMFAENLKICGIITLNTMDILSICGAILMIIGAFISTIIIIRQMFKCKDVCFKSRLILIIHLLIIWAYCTNIYFRRILIYAT